MITSRSAKAISIFSSWKGDQNFSRETIPTGTTKGKAGARARAHTHTHTHAHTHIHTHIHIHTEIHTHTHSLSLSLSHTMNCHSARHLTTSKPEDEFTRTELSGDEYTVVESSLANNDHTLSPTKPRYPAPAVLKC